MIRGCHLTELFVILLILLSKVAPAELEEGLLVSHPEILDVVVIP